MQLKTQLLGRLEKEGGGEFSMPGYGSYLTGDGRWVYLLILTDAHWAKLTKALAMPEDGDDGLLEAARPQGAARTGRGGGQRRHWRADLSPRPKRSCAPRDWASTKSCRSNACSKRRRPAQPGKLRELDFRGLHFEVPEFPGGQRGRARPAAAGTGRTHVEAAARAGLLRRRECAALLASGAVEAFAPGDFAWAPVRDKV